VDLQLVIHTRRITERELCSDSWIYIQGEWLKGNCVATVGYTYRASG